MKKNAMLVCGWLMLCFLWPDISPVFAAPTNNYSLETRASLGLFLSLSNRTLLQAVITNHTSQPMMFVHDLTLQSSELILRDNLGKEIISFDSRSRMKFDNTVLESSYTTIPAHASLVLYEGAFSPLAAGTFSFHWGPYEYNALKPGAYDAQVVFKSAIDWLDHPGAKTRSHPAGIWVGQIRSDTIHFKLRSTRPSGSDAMP